MQWKAIDPKWLAEASSMTLAEVYHIAESQPITTFPCLVCGAELVVRNRRHGIRMQLSVEDYCADEAGHGSPAELLCKICEKQSNDLAEQQRLLDRERYQALLAEYRARPYEDRRETREWKILKRRIHKRDGYRCRLCGRDNVELHVHHCTYANYAQERLEDLITLCSACHRHFHFSSEAS